MGATSSNSNSSEGETPAGAAVGDCTGWGGFEKEADLGFQRPEIGQAVGELARQRRICSAPRREKR
uniref:Uncharacterized protein n=1 Tax=Oryza meridionalis TaxID=40149 RepID=A0A0E0E7U9_9ORYZ